MTAADEEILNDVRALAYSIDGYELWGSFERCAEVAKRVLAAARAAQPVATFTTDELRTALFFAARAERHTGAPEGSNAEAVIAAAIVKRMGMRWCRAEINRRRRAEEAGADPREDASFGALLGAACGDAAGAFLEFIGRAPTAAEVTQALQMPGGGVWKVAPGQVTDDAELMICLARGLASAASFDIENIAREYAAWYRSPPFDIGSTTRASIGAVGEHLKDGLASTMRAAAAARCGASKANGSLMRAAPIGVFSCQRSNAEIAELARADSSLTHPNKACCDAVACYAIAIAHLVATPGDRTGALEQVDAWASVHAGPEVQGWLDDARNARLPPTHPLAGFVKIAFTHAFGHLLAGSHFEEAVRAVLLLGGDSDTNACIVGGLIGAADGAEAIPKAMRDAVLTCRTEEGRPRPDFLHPRQLPTLARTFVVQAGNWV